MQIIQNRRHFLAGITAISAVGLAGGRNVYAEDAPLDTTTVRFTHAPSTCNAPLYLAEELLRADGFTNLTYVDVDAGVNTPMNLASGEADIGFEYASAFVIAIDAGTPVKVLGGLHAGCYELFAREGITSVLGLKGKRIGVGQNLKSDAYLFVGAMAIHVGLDPLRDIDWVIDAEAKPMQLFIDGKVDAFLGFGTECQELRAKKIGHSIVSGVLDRRRCGSQRRGPSRCAPASSPGRAAAGDDRRPPPRNPCRLPGAAIHGRGTASRGRLCRSSLCADDRGFGGHAGGWRHRFQPGGPGRLTCP